MKDISAGRGSVSLRRWLYPEQQQDESIGAAFLVMVTLLAALLRLYRLGAAPLWIDELITLQQAAPGYVFWRQMLDTIQGPLYVASIWPLVRQGAGEFMLRLPAVVAGVATVPLLAVLAGRICGARTARLVALLLALGPFHLWYCQEARGYSYVVLFSVASTLVLLDMMRDGPRLRTALAFGLLTVGGVWSNLSALFLWGGQGLVVLLLARPADARQWRLWALAFGTGLLAVLPWVLKASGIVAIDRLVPTAATGVALRGESTFSVLAWPFTVFTFFFGNTLGPALRELRGDDRLAVVLAHWPVLSAAAAVVLASLVSGLARLRKRQWVLVLLCILPALAVTILAIRNVKTFNPRYVAVIYPFVLVVAAHGLAHLPRRAGIVLSVLMLGLCSWSVGNHYWNDRYAKADVRTAALHVASSQWADWPVVVPEAAVVYEWYRQGGPKPISWWDAGRLESESEIDRVLQQKLDGVGRCWFVLYRSWVFDPQDFLPVVLAAGGEIVEQKEYRGVRLLRWLRTDPVGADDSQD